MTRRADVDGHPAARHGRPPRLASGVGLALSLPPWGCWILAFPAAGLLWWRLGGLRPRTRLWAGWLAGLGCYVPGLMWARAFTLPGAVVLIAVEAGFMAVACLAVPPGPVAARALAFPAALTLAEAARMTWPFGGLPIGGVFLGQAGGPVLGRGPAGRPPRPHRRRLPRRGGSGALVGGRPYARAGDGPGAQLRRGPTGGRSGALAGRRRRSRPERVAGRGRRRTARDRAARRRTSRSPCWWSRSASPPTTPPTAGRSVGHGHRRRPSRAAVPAASASPQIDPARRAGRPDRGHRRARMRATSGHRPELVLWPEDVVSLDTPSPTHRRRRPSPTWPVASHTTLVVGVTETVSATAFRNEVVAFGPDGTLVARYEKVHRVPFGEYVPYRSFFAHLANLSAVPLDAIPGTGTGLLPTPAAPLGAMVSYEVFYADRGRASVRAGAQLLIVPTNTSSYATAQVPTQEIAAAEVQAVQQGRDLLQAAPTGYSAAITNRGTLLASLGARRPPGGHGHPRPADRLDPLRPLRGPAGPRRRAGRPSHCGWLARPAVAGRPGRRRSLLVVPRVDVHAGDPLGVEHGEVVGVVLEGQPQVEPVGAQLVDAVPLEPGHLRVVPPRPHDQQVPAQPVPLQPGQGLGLHPHGPAGEQDRPAAGGRAARAPGPAPR